MNSVTTAGRTILIVEDEPDFSAMLEYRLQRRGYEVVKAFDGRSGVEEAVRCQPNLIVLDLMLPKMMGLEVCRHIRSNPTMTHVPIFILTALDSITHRTKGVMFGADGYFTKGNQVPELLREIDVMFRGKRAGDVESICGSAEFVASLVEETLAQIEKNKQADGRQTVPLSES